MFKSTMVDMYPLLTFFTFLGENKTVIMKSIQSTSENPLLKLESMADSEIYDQRQVGFCSQWSLDNICEPTYT